MRSQGRTICRPDGSQHRSPERKLRRSTPGFAPLTLVPLGKRTSFGIHEVEFTDQHGDRHECIAESFTQTHQVFIAIRAVKTLALPAKMLAAAFYCFNMLDRIVKERRFKQTSVNAARPVSVNLRPEWGAHRSKSSPQSRRRTLLEGRPAHRKARARSGKGTAALGRTGPVPAQYDEDGLEAKLREGTPLSDVVTSLLPSTLYVLGENKRETIPDHARPRENARHSKEDNYRSLKIISDRFFALTK